MHPVEFTTTGCPYGQTVRASRIPIRPRGRLCSHLATLKLDAPLVIGYAFYDVSSDGDLDVVLNDEFHPAFAEATVHLTSALV